MERIVITRKQNETVGLIWIFEDDPVDFLFVIKNVENPLKAELIGGQIWQSDLLIVVGSLLDEKRFLDVERNNRRSDSSL